MRELGSRSKGFSLADSKISPSMREWLCDHQYIISGRLDTLQLTIEYVLIQLRSGLLAVVEMLG